MGRERACEKRRVGRQGQGRLSVAAVELDAPGREKVHGGRLDPFEAVAADAVGPQGVDGDENDVVVVADLETAEIGPAGEKEESGGQGQEEAGGGRDAVLFFEGHNPILAYQGRKFRDMTPFS